MSLCPKYYVFPQGSDGKGALLISARTHESLVEKAANLVMVKRQEWGKAPLRVLEYGGMRAWDLDWSDRRLKEVA